MANAQPLHHGTRGRTAGVDPLDVLLRTGIVTLAIATGAIHLTLGGLLFTLNGLGYLVAAVAMVLPWGLAVRFRWLIRLGLIGYAAVTILGWALDGPRYDTAYLAKAIEVALIGLVALEFWRLDGSPVDVARREVRGGLRALRRATAR